MALLRISFSSLLLLPFVAPQALGAVLPSVADNLVCYYDFDHPVADNPGMETDMGRSGTNIELVNGGPAMRTADPAYPKAGRSLQTRQVHPDANGNDDWKAGLYNANGVATLDAFDGVAGITLMGWVKPTGRNPGRNSMTGEPDDFFGAVGLFGLLSGTSEGHLVRALIEIMQVDGELRLVALGRRQDTGTSQIFAADTAWERLIPADTWTHIAATFDYDNGTLALYRNGESVPGTYTASDDPWATDGPPEPDLASASLPRGIKIGGSYPQNTQERNPFNGGFDDLMFFDRVLSSREIREQYASFF
jgi:hypothetical protein